MCKNIIMQHNKLEFEIAVRSMVKKIWPHYELPLAKLMKNPRTGAPAILPEDWDSRAELISFALHDPQVAFVWGNDIAYSQLEIWHPYIMASKHRFTVIANNINPSMVEKQNLLLKQTQPYSLKKNFKIEYLNAAPSLKTLIYISDKNNNYNFLRKLQNKIHVCGHHGDSEKHSSFSTMPNSYDFLLLADQISMLRYIKGGLELPINKIIPIGNTVIPNVNYCEGKSLFTKAIYAPTFEGYSESVNYSSLMRASNHITNWSNSNNNSLYFRPHPGTGLREKSYITYIDKIKASITPIKLEEKSEQFNWSDFIVTDISGIISEYLFTGKPIIIPVSTDPKWLRDYIIDLSLDSYIYIWDYNQLTLSQFIESIKHDPLQNSRITRRNAIYLGIKSFEKSLELFDEAITYFEYAYQWRQLRTGKNYTQDSLSLRKYPLPNNQDLKKIVSNIKSGLFAQRKFDLS